MAFSMESEPSTSTDQWSQPCRKFELHEILLATENFNESFVIGKGGFGKVYKGEVIVGTSRVAAAIKRLDSMSDQGAAEFWAEVEMLSKLRHSHLVSLIGYCNYKREMILVYEYMPNGTLEDHLHKLRTHLSWVDRLKICIGAARGLDYLHTGTGIEFGVIHRDVKSSNILLHESWAAKISDFGLSRIGPTNQPRTYVNTHVKGTFGYLDPNYFATGKLTRKSDVYAFGVVLFEVLCQKQPVDRSLEWGLATWAQESIKEGNLKNIVDSDIRGEISPKCLKGFARIAERCLDNHPKDRPTMTEVIFSLESVLTLQLHTPGKSIFTRMVDVFFFNSIDENPGTAGFGFLTAKKREQVTLRKTFVEPNGAPLFEDHPQGTNTHIGSDQGNSYPTSKNEEPTSKQVTLSDPVNNNEDDLDAKGNRNVGNEGEQFANWNSKNSTYKTTHEDLDSYSPSLIPNFQFPDSFDFSDSSDPEAADNDPLPTVESLQISGEAFPGQEVQVSGYSVNGTKNSIEGNEGEQFANWNSKNSTYKTTHEDLDSYSLSLTPIIEFPDSSDSEAADDSSDSEAADDDPLPSVESLQISGEAFPGHEVQASGYSLNGTTSCSFEWVRHMEDGSVNYIKGARGPNYLVNADDVGTYLAIEVQPMDNRKRKGKLVKGFANEHREIVCDLKMHDHIRKALQAGYAEHRLSSWNDYFYRWEPVKLVVKKDGINIKGSGTRVNAKFSATTTVFVPYGNPVEFSINNLGSVERRLRVEQESAAVSSRDIIVLTMRYFIRRAVDKKKVKTKGLFF